MVKTIRWQCVGLLLGVMLTGCVGPQGPRWIVTQLWEGSGTQQTQKFWVNGTPWRVLYRPSGKGVFQVGLYDADGAFLRLLAEQDELMPGGVTIREPGRRYLAVTGVDTRWKITVEQYLSTIEEWQLTETVRQTRFNLAKLGTWAGRDTDQDYEIEVPTGSWQARYSNLGAGTVQITVRDQDGNVVMALNMESPSEGEGWIHQNGRFTMHVTATDAKWKVDVYNEQPE